MSNLKEYRVDDISGSPFGCGVDDEDDLNAIAAEGWRLVAIIAADDAWSFRMFWERDKADLVVIGGAGGFALPEAVQPTQDEYGL